MVPEPAEAIVRCAVARRSLRGETATGDRHIIKRHHGRVLMAVVDGLGHGADAARAAEIAVETIGECSTDDLIEIMQSCDRALRRSRGAVITVVSFEKASRQLECLAVGNVQGMLAHLRPPEGKPRREFVVLRGGVIGHTVPQLKTTVMTVQEGDTLVLATDGIRIDFTTDRRLSEPTGSLADRILASYGIESDDALVLVARFLGVKQP